MLSLQAVNVQGDGYVNYPDVPTTQRAHASQHHTLPHLSLQSLHVDKNQGNNKSVGMAAGFPDFNLMFHLVPLTGHSIP